jgi:hypothetical protein
LPQDCEALAQQVPVPQFRRGANPKAALVRTTGALHEANGNLDATAECQKAQRERLKGSN